MEEETYNNYSQVDSRKRPLDDTTNKREAKKPAFSTDKPLLKLLVPNYVAGALIGKGGSFISEMETKFGGTIRLSPNREFYPGTGERIVVISADISQLIEYCSHIMEKVKGGQFNESSEIRPRDEGRAHQVKIVLTNQASGLLIGKGGETIKGIHESTKAKMVISNRDQSSVPGERVLTISGEEDQITEGCKQAIEIIAEEPSNMANNRLKYASGDMNMGAVFGRREINDFPNNHVAGFQAANITNNSLNLGMGVPSPNRRRNLKTKVEIQMDVPDILVGAVLGRQGANVSQLMQFSGAKIQFSGKNEYVTGTTDRILTITGNKTQTDTAYELVSQKIEQVENELGASIPRY